jgi:hypothetical protein
MGVYQQLQILFRLVLADTAMGKPQSNHMSEDLKFQINFPLE